MEIAALDKEEAELVEKLKQEGFVLYEAAAQAATEKKIMLYAEDIEEDMNDPMNWKVGDKVEVISKDVQTILPYGSIQEVTKIEDDGMCFTDAYDGCKDSFDCIPEYFKFHSRPNK